MLYIINQVQKAYIIHYRSTYRRRILYIIDQEQKAYVIHYRSIIEGVCYTL